MKSKLILQVKNVSKAFGTDKNKVQAVDDISFEVSSGEVILIMGPSGSGKTTLLTMIGALLTADTGSILYGDIDITTQSKNDLAQLRSQEIGFIFQSFNLLTSLNVWENVAAVLELIEIDSKTAKMKSQKILSDFGLSGRLNYHINDLSGGEQQRVSIARALATDPNLILADEPTANLDSKSGHKVMEMLKSIAKQEGKAVVIVSHDMRLLDIADRVLWIEDGKVKEGQQILVIDPVCEMKIQQDLAPFNLKHDGKIDYFCSKKCFDEFKKSLKKGNNHET